jgi:predicted anti-sigma-YlaC factor YlaD
MILALQPSSIAGIVTAVTGLVTAVGGVVLSVTVLIPLLKTSKSTHGIVNQQRTDMLKYQAELKEALTDAGVVVPGDKSLDTPAGPQ